MPTPYREPSKTLDESIVMLMVDAGVNFWKLRLEAGTTLILHKRRLPLHHHDRELDIIVGADVSVSAATPTLPGNVQSWLTKGFVGARVGKGTQHSYYVHDQLPFSLHATGKQSEPLSIVSASGGIRSAQRERTHFAAWNQARRELSMYRGSAATASTPSTHILASLVNRFGKATMQHALDVVSENANILVLDGRQETFAF